MDTTIWKQNLEQLFPNYAFDIDAILQLVMQGKIGEAAGQVMSSFGQAWSQEFMSFRELLVSLLIVGVIAAVFSEFAEVFSGKQISQVGFYLIYLFLIAILTKTFLYTADIASEAIGTIVLFIRLFIPTYYMAVGAANGITTATLSYQLILLVAYGVETILLTALLPMIYSYVILALLNGLWIEERLHLMLELIKKGIGFLLKTAVGIVTGFSMVQSMIAPAIDQVRLTAVKKTISVIPGIGNLAEGMSEMVLGSAVLIKNSVGVVLLFLLGGMCLLPLLRLLIVTGILKLGAAMIGIVSDKRIADCTNHVGDGSLLLFKTVGSAMLLFIIMIAMTAYTTG